MRRSRRWGFVVLLAAITGYMVHQQNSIDSAGFLEESLLEIERHLPKRAARNQAVSHVPVAWHLDHSLKVVNSICDALTVSNPQNFEHSFSASRFYCFTLGYIPRGVAQSPKAVRPPAIITPEDLLLQLEMARVKLRSIEGLDEKAHFEHPYFKMLDKGQAKRFVKIHTEHHLKIIRDILEK